MARSPCFFLHGRGEEHRCNLTAPAYNQEKSHFNALDALKDESRGSATHRVMGEVRVTVIAVKPAGEKPGYSELGTSAEPRYDPAQRRGSALPLIPDSVGS